MKQINEVRAYAYGLSANTFVDLGDTLYFNGISNLREEHVRPNKELYPIDWGAEMSENSIKGRQPVTSPSGKIEV